MTLFRTLNETATQIVGARGSAVETARGRLIVMAIVFALVFGGVGLRVAWLCLFQEGAEPRFESLHAGNEASAVLAVGRGDILDRNGVLLATTLETLSLYADPKLIIDAPVVARDLKKVFPEINETELAQKLTSKSRFIWVQRGVSPQKAAAVNALGYPGLDFRSESRRFYPQENLVSHIVGYTGVDGDGFAGVERSFNAALKQSSKPLKLTIDVRFQHALRRAMLGAVTKFNAKGASGAIVDVQSGDILAAVSLPDFNPQDINAATDDQKFNRFALGVYEMGSTFKAFSTAALLDRVDPSLGQRFDASKPIKTGRFTITDYHAQNRVMTVPEVFMYSSNIGTARMGEKVGTPVLKSFLFSLGFDKPVPLAISEKAAPLVPNPWRDVSTLTISYGHGMSVTPLHLIRAFSAIVNGGVLPALHIAYGEHDETRPRIISEATSEQMRHLLRLVVTHGTGSKANIPGTMIGGKTGTTEKNIDGRYVKNKLISSFVATFPADQPRYAVLVSVDEPVGNKESYGYATAGWVATPPVADVVQAIMTLENMPQADTKDDEAIESEMMQYIKLDAKHAKGAAAAPSDR